MAPADLIWMCVKKNSSFIRKSPNMPVMTAEPGNLTGLNSYKFSGLASAQVLNVASVKTGSKESIILTTRNKKASRSARPARLYVENGINKQAKKGLQALDKVMDAGYYRRDLLDLAKIKYAKIKKSFKRKKMVVKSRRVSK
jgi:large subunit ribosomal protein L28e